MKLAVSEARIMTPHNSREKTGVYTSYSKMVATEISVLLFSCKLALDALFLKSKFKNLFS